MPHEIHASDRRTNLGLYEIPKVWLIKVKVKLEEFVGLGFNSNII